MAHVSKETKAAVLAALKAVMPAGYKFSLAIRHHSTLVMTISAAPVDLVKIAVAQGFRAYDGHVQLGSQRLANNFKGSEVAELFAKIQSILYSKEIGGYYDKSEAMIDYFDTAYYVDVQLGRFDKGFQHNA